MASHGRILLKILGSSVFRQYSLLSSSAEVHSLKIGVIGVPFAKGQSNNDGVRDGPAVLREGGILKELTALGHNVRDFKDIDSTSNVDESCEDNTTNNNSTAVNMKGLADVAACNHQLSNKVVEVLDTESRVLVLGGDHSVAVGSADGHIRSKGDIGMLYIDAHADLNTADTSPSGNVHGMALALLVKELHDYWPYLPGMDWQKPLLPASNIAYIGLRSVDKFERLILEKFSITAFGMAEVEKYGIDKVCEMALDKVDPQGKRSLHVSFDIDCLDTLEAPSTGVPVRGGLTLREGVHIMEIVHQTGRLFVMDLVEVNPHIGTDRDVRKTIEAGIHVTKAAFGFSRLGNVPKHVSDIPGRYASFTHKEDSGS